MDRLAEVEGAWSERELQAWRRYGRRASWTRSEVSSCGRAPQPVGRHAGKRNGTFDLLSSGYRDAASRQ
ncbi:hypothetical protein PI124_g20851 [Phytophthora idaei]|nr:hypothetical protein PI125_g23164 [Phytophthora idaei]KAG3234093.1 hypothetical protein PI124_g20851 [Phytophthora idaei]